MDSPFWDRHPSGHLFAAPNQIQNRDGQKWPTKPLPPRIDHAQKIIVLRGHRAQAGPDGNAPAMLEAHFLWLSGHCHCVLPGEILSQDKPNVCLTFDDAYFDFYAVVWPLLEKHGLRAVLGVTPRVIREVALFPAETRINAPVDLNQSQLYTDSFCTWPELSTLAASGQVMIAAQSYHSHSLNRKDIDFTGEIARSQEELSGRLNQTIDCFAFPDEEFCGAAVRKVHEYYRYVFGGGPAINRSWSRSLLFRCNNDEMTAPNSFLPKTSSMASKWWPFRDHLQSA